MESSSSSTSVDNFESPFLSSDFDRDFESRYNIFDFWEKTYNLYYFFNDFQISYSDKLSESYLGDLINVR
jgi:hypothetical protein